MESVKENELLEVTDKMRQDDEKRLFIEDVKDMQDAFKGISRMDRISIWNELYATERDEIIRGFHSQFDSVPAEDTIKVFVVELLHELGLDVYDKAFSKDLWNAKNE
jgi:predicted metallopeptidase